MTLEKFERMQQDQPLYLRFGKPPKTGHSHNARINRALPGTCCFEGEFFLLDEDYAKYEIDTSSHLHDSGDLLTALVVRTPAWLLTGKEVGRDPDVGTPLVMPARWWKLPSNVDLGADPCKPNLVVELRAYNESERKQRSLRELDRRYKKARRVLGEHLPAAKALASMGSGFALEGVLAEVEGAAAARQRHGTVRKIGRNEPCPCGSGKKFKKCCGA